MLQISTAKSVSHYDRFIAKPGGLEPESITVANVHTEHSKANIRWSDGQGNRKRSDQTNRRFVKFREMASGSLRA